jgi:hypothetical protein
MPMQRCFVHELYLRALTDSNPESFDLDFATIVDCLWPSREQASKHGDCIVARSALDLLQATSGKIGKADDPGLA